MKRVLFLLMTTLFILILLLTSRPLSVIPQVSSASASDTENKALRQSDAVARINDLSDIPQLMSNSRTFETVTYVRINEISPNPEPGFSEWVELKNWGTEPLNIGGFGLTDEDGQWYQFPEEIPAVPAGGFVLVQFDGLGKTFNEYDFSDNVAVLHSDPGLTDIFRDSGDQAALYDQAGRAYIYLPMIVSVSTVSRAKQDAAAISSVNEKPKILDFVAWGISPDEDDDNAVNAGLWWPQWHVNVSRSTGVMSDESGLQAGESIGLLPESSGAPSDWVAYQPSEVTSGAENGHPSINWYYPAAGAIIDGDTFAVSWNAVEGASGYQFQMSDSMNFDAPLVDLALEQPSYIPTSPVADGTYYWRVKVKFGTKSSPWTQGVPVESVTVPQTLIGTGRTESSSIISNKVLGIQWQLQHKDTLMLDLGGSAETGERRWDGPHLDSRGVPVIANGLDSSYCVRASVSMIASYYGGQLSQDRISYQLFGERTHEEHLGYGTGPAAGEISPLLNWALGADMPMVGHKPSFEEIKVWIEDDRPLLSIIPGHMRVIDGYREIRIDSGTLMQQIHLLDPVNRARWVNYNDDPIVAVWVGPAGINGAPSVKSDEDYNGKNGPDTMEDSDNDGVCDFDEIRRFGLQMNNPDSDGDQVRDKQDIRAYVFNAGGSYNLRRADFDKDGKRKELDPDNDRKDDDGSWDGCEDVNHNGKYESGLGETSNFDGSDDRDCFLISPEAGAVLDNGCDFPIYEEATVWDFYWEHVPVPINGYAKYEIRIGTPTHPILIRDGNESETNYRFETGGPVTNLGPWQWQVKATQYYETGLWMGELWSEVRPFTLEPLCLD